MKRLKNLCSRARAGLEKGCQRSERHGAKDLRVLEVCMRQCENKKVLYLSCLEPKGVPP